MCIQENKLVEKMFKLQGGSKGFYEQMQCAILICGDLRNYGFYEQIYLLLMEDFMR